MKQFFSFIRKEFLHIVRDKQTLLIILGMPVAQILLLGFAITTEVKNVRIAFWDPSNDAATRRIEEKFSANRYFELQDMVTDPSRIEELFRKDVVDLVVVFEERFQENLLHTGTASVQFITDGTDPNTATMIGNYATQIITAYQTETSALAGIPLQVIPQVKLLYNPQMESSYNFVPGVMGLILMLICAMMTSVSIVREKERGTMEVLLVSPIKPIFIILAKATAYMGISIINLISIVLLAVYVIGVPMVGSIFWLGLVSVIFMLAALALGLLISSLVKTQVAAILASGMVLMMPTMLLSGMIFPVDSMPGILQGVSTVIPATWYVSAIRKIMIQGLDITYAAKEVGILLAMAAVLITVSLKKFKYRLE